MFSSIFTKRIMFHTNLFGKVATESEVVLPELVYRKYFKLKDPFASVYLKKY